MSTMTTRADIIRVLHQAYVDNGWMPPTLDGYADALIAAGYGKVDGDEAHWEAEHAALFRRVSVLCDGWERMARDGHKWAAALTGVTITLRAALDDTIEATEPSA